MKERELYELQTENQKLNESLNSAKDFAFEIWTKGKIVTTIHGMGWNTFPFVGFLSRILDAKKAPKGR